MSNVNNINNNSEPPMEVPPLSGLHCLTTTSGGGTAAAVAATAAFQSGSQSGSIIPTTPSHSYAPRPMEIAESIRTLHELHQLGGLTQEEFVQAKQQILESPSTSTASQKGSKGGSRERRRHRRRPHDTGSSTHTKTSKSKSKSSRGSRRRNRRKARSSSSRRSRRSKSSSSSSSSSSSGSGGSRFIVVPRANVWRTLRTSVLGRTRGDFPTRAEEDGSGLGYSPVAMSPLYPGSNSGGVGTSAAVDTVDFTSGGGGGGGMRGRRRTRPIATTNGRDGSVGVGAGGGILVPSSLQAAEDTEETALLVCDTAAGANAATAATCHKAASSSAGSIAAHSNTVRQSPLPPSSYYGAMQTATTAPPSQRGSHDGRRASTLMANQPSFTASDHQQQQQQAQRPKYGTFFQPSGAAAGTADHHSEMLGHGPGGDKVLLEPEHEVHVRYFNSRGGNGDRFSEVQLKEEELRRPFFLHKGVASMLGEYPYGSTLAAVVPVEQANGAPAAASESGGGDAQVQQAVITEMGEDGQPQTFQLEPVGKLTEEEKRAWSAMSKSGRNSRTSSSPSSSSRSSGSSSSSSSFLEQSLNWYWIDVTGRDPSRRRYNSALRFLTKRFTICELFLVDREHILMQPQMVESPNHPGQYLLNLRVATHKIAISDDSVIELTNRWIIIVDLRQHFVLTLHRVDTHSMAQLRSHWRRIMEQNDVSFQEFLLKVIDDALQTYELSLDVHADLLDRCESKLFANENKLVVNDAAASKTRTTKPGDTEYSIDLRILHHFAGSSRSGFLRQLLDVKDRRPMNKMEMNSFLHHLHRRTSVQHRMLNATQTVLQKAFTKLQLCSREMADQMCGNCMELSVRALEVRDDAKTLLDLHISLQSFRTNELMAVLTRVSLFFTPCTFLAGVYGMNFRYMPELDWHFSYPVFWVFCVVLMLAMQRYIFKF